MRRIERLAEYRVSERVVLRPGDRFRVSQGPYWRFTDGTREPMATRGVCTFLGAFKQGARVFIEAADASGFTLLHVGGRRRNRDMPQLVCRPYKVRGRVRGKAGAR